MLSKYKVSQCVGECLRYPISLQSFKINHQTLENFLHQVELGYSKHKNPYHNLVHGADVAQTAHWLLSQTGFTVILVIVCWSNKCIANQKYNFKPSKVYTITKKFGTFSYKRMLFSIYSPSWIEARASIHILQQLISGRNSISWNY